jgi:hypothetical protein
MEQIQKLKAELEQVQKELKELCNLSYKAYYTQEINRLIRRKAKLQIKINQLRQSRENQ